MDELAVREERDRHVGAEDEARQQVAEHDGLAQPLEHDGRDGRDAEDDRQRDEEAVGIHPVDIINRPAKENYGDPSTYPKCRWRAPSAEDDVDELDDMPTGEAGMSPGATSLDDDELDAAVGLAAGTSVHQGFRFGSLGPEALRVEVGERRFLCRQAASSTPHADAEPSDDDERDERRDGHHDGEHHQQCGQDVFDE